MWTRIRSRLAVGIHVPDPSSTTTITSTLAPVSYINMADSVPRLTQLSERDEPSVSLIWASYGLLAK
jgi:hypothetical protein